MIDRITSWIRRCGRFVRRTETLPLVALTAACLLFEEWYPLSHFPMYSSFTSSTYYVYLADGADRPLATLDMAGMNTPALKKVYDGELRRERRRIQSSGGTINAEQTQAVGRAVLERVKNSPPAQAAGEALPDVLRLYRVDLELREGRFEKRTTLAGELR
jgi:hypothetical protein